MVLVDLTNRPDVGLGMISSPNEIAAQMGTARGGARALDLSNPYATTRIRGTDAGFAAAVRVQTPA